MHLILHALLFAGLLPLFLRWSRLQSERQIDKMQRSVFNSPGAEAPVPPAVIVGGCVLLGGYLLLGRRFLRLSAWQLLTSLSLGAAGGIVVDRAQRRASAK
jgi:hypothetical protein